MEEQKTVSAIAETYQGATLIKELRHQIAVSTADSIADAARKYINAVGGLVVMPATAEITASGRIPNAGLQAFPRVIRSNVPTETLVSVHAFNGRTTFIYYGFPSPIAFISAYPGPAFMVYKGSRDFDGESEKLGLLILELHAQITNPKCKAGDVILVGADPDYPNPTFCLYKAFKDLDIECKGIESKLFELIHLPTRGLSDPEYKSRQQEIKELQSQAGNLRNRCEAAWTSYVQGNW